MFIQSERPSRNTRFLVTNTYSTPEILYYDSKNSLNGLVEYTKTLCVSENDQMAYKLIVET